MALAACGGGGGGSAPVAGAPVATTPAADRTVQGTAAKGLIKGAKVSVYALDAQGVRGTTALATTTTGADGTYKLQVPASVQNFVIEVSAATGAVMADEATGTDIAIPDGMKLRSVVTLADNAAGTYEGTVSPLTEMVARTAETADGKLPQAAVAQAKVNVRTMLGFDPETVKPVNSNSDAAANASEDEKNQSLTLAAISKMGSTASADCGQSGAGERIACVVTKLASSVKVANGQPSLEQNQLASFRDAVQAVAQDKAINHTGKSQVVGIPVLATPVSTAPATEVPVTTTPTTPPPATTTPATPATDTPATTTPATPSTGTPATTTPAGASAAQVAATKALFGSLRTNLRALDQGDAFRSTADGIKADLAGTVAPLSNDVSGLATLVPSMIDILNTTRASTYTYRTSAVVHNNLATTGGIFYDIANGEGSCTITATPLSITCTVIQATNLPGTVATDFTTGTMVYANRVFKLEQKADSTTDYTYTAYLQKASSAYSGFMLSGDPTLAPIGAVQSGTITYARSGSVLSQLTIKGGMTGRLDGNGTLVSDNEDWSLNVARTQEANNLMLYKFDGAFTAYKAGQPSGKIEIDNTSFLRVAMTDSTGKVAQDAANELQITLRGTLADTTVNGTLRASDDKLDKSKTSHSPTKLSFAGSFKHKDATLFSGNVALTRNGWENYDATGIESDTNFAHETVELNGTLSVPSRPDLKLTVGATRTGKDAVDVSAQYRDGTSVVNASVSTKIGERHPLVKVSSAEGVAFSFTDTSTPVKVTKDGAVVAELNLGKGMITYIDGTTESIK